jgi:UDPglucose 6-dehydrogenase
MKISVVGTGYVGLVTGTCFAETGVTVTCVDIDKRKIDMLHHGQLPIYEPGLDDLIKRNVEKDRLFFTTEIEQSLIEADVAFIAVGTPPDEDGSADLRYVLGVANDIGRYLDHYMVVVTKSTVPIGTAVKVRAAVQAELDRRGMAIEFDVASNPEFLKEDSAIGDFLKPDRIVCGVDNDRAEKTLARLYKPFVLNGHPLLFMDIPSAEMTKYAANSMLATKISFMNEISNLCEIVGADVDMVRKGIGSDTRIGPKFIYPGVGYGGSCFPKDVKALIKTAQDKGYSMRVLRSVEDVNDDQKRVMFNKVNHFFNGNLAGKTIALWGLAFKPNTDDMREAPSLVFIGQMLEAGARVVAYDPVAMHEAERKLGNVVKYAKDQYEALLDADALVLLTEWPEFRQPNYQVMAKLMKNRVVFDGRNVYDSEEVAESGFQYIGMGRKVR